VWPAREATSNVANGGHTIYLSVALQKTLASPKWATVPNLTNGNKI